MARGDQERITAAYDSSARAYADRCFHELDYKPLDRLLLDRLTGLIPPGGLVCDIGCGPGEIADYLHKKKIEVVGIDISDNMIREAKRLNPEIAFMCGDMFNLAVPNNYFSGICSFYAIVNFDYEAIRKIIREYYRVLVREGVLFIAFHAGEETLHLDDFFESGKPLDFYYLDAEKIRGYLQDTGFAILESLVRAPYKEEYPSRRAYILCMKSR